MTSNGRKSTTYNGEMPSMSVGNVFRFEGTSPHSQTKNNHVTYVWKQEREYRIAVLNGDGEFEFDTVTEQWSPPSRLYDRAVAVGREEFPRQA